MSAAEYKLSAPSLTRAHSHTFRIVNPCAEIVGKKDRDNIEDALTWLRFVKLVRKDPFLELERFDGHRWIGQLEDTFDCCA